MFYLSSTICIHWELCHYILYYVMLCYIILYYIIIWAGAAKSLKLLATDWMIGVWFWLIPDKSRNFIQHHIQEQPEIYTTSHPLSSVSILVGLKWLKYKADLSPPFSAEFKNVWSIASIALYNFMAWCLAMGTSLPFLLLHNFSLDNLNCRYPMWLPCWDSQWTLSVTEWNCWLPESSHLLLWWRVWTNWKSTAHVWHWWEMEWSTTSVWRYQCCS